MKTSAQNKEDRVIVQYFEGKRDGVFVDVGAHDGVQFSNTHLLETDYDWTGVCIEPNPESYRKLVKNRPNSKCFEVAIVNHEPRRVQLLVPCGVAVLGSTSPSRKGIGQILSINPSNVSYQKHSVQGEPLGVILEPMFPELDSFNEWTDGGLAHDPVYDLLSIDTEWTELDVLKSAMLYKFIPEVIVVEANDSVFAGEIREFLEIAGYCLCGFVGGINYFYVAKKTNVKRMSEAIAHVVSGNSPNM